MNNVDERADAELRAPLTLTSSVGGICVAVAVEALDTASVEGATAESVAESTSLIVASLIFVDCMLFPSPSSMFILRRLWDEFGGEIALVSVVATARTNISLLWGCIAGRMNAVVVVARTLVVACDVSFFSAAVRLRDIGVVAALTYAVSRILLSGFIFQVGQEKES